MQEAVSSILIGRRRDADGLSRMVTLSLGVHVLALAAVALVPSGWFSSGVERPHNVTTISLGGPAGTQDTGGMTPQATRQVQELAADSRTVTRTPASAPEMLAPAPEAKPTTAKPVPKPAEKSATRKPSTGKEVQIGPARADVPNATQVPFGGLSSSANSTGGVRVEGNFCCPEYLEEMKRAIHRNWNQNVGVMGSVEIKFTIRRDGVLTNVGVEKGSGNPILDLESRKAVHETRQVPPLPDRFTGPALTVYLIFEYKR